MKLFIFAILVGISSCAIIGTPEEDVFGNAPEDDVFGTVEIPFEPAEGQRCAGRNYEGRRCCTPENPCDEGEGDCDGPLDGGTNDGHAGCKGNLVCGSNNCQQFGHYYHPKDDCCERPSAPVTPAPVNEQNFPNAPSQPPAGQRCSGRNFEGGRRCCTPENPCNAGEGDCDGPLDGGGNDGHAGCKGNLVCGSNNCKQFGSYFHPKDDCCEDPSFGLTPEEEAFGPVTDGWGEWETFSQCTARCGGGTHTRNKYCIGSSCSHTTQTQTQPCNTKPC